MTTNIKELDKSIELLLKEISEFKQQVQSLNECEENYEKLKNKKLLTNNNETQVGRKQFLQINRRLTTNTNDSNQKKFQEKETEFDQINELYWRNKLIVDNKKNINDLIMNFQSQFSQIIKQAEKKKEEYANQSNDLLIEMKQIEK